MKRIIAFWIAAFLLITQFSSAQAAGMTYEDVPDAAWYAESVRYMSDRSLMNGVGGNRFDPDGLVTRAMFVTILYRLDGAAELSEPSRFEDVSENSYYRRAVAWASNNGIVGGYNSKQFGPDDHITREQLAVILYRYATKKGQDTTQKSTLEQYIDADQISAYALDAMRWAHAEGIVNGVSSSALGPQSSATRSQVAAMVMRFDLSYSNDAEGATGGSNGASVYYTVVFKDYDGTTLKTEAVQDGGKAVPPGTPKRSGYLFNGWDGNYGSIHSDQIFTAQYYQEILSNENQATPKDRSQASATEDAISQPTILVARVDAESGSKNVIVPVEIKNNPGILGMTLTVRYDDSVLTLISAENGAAVSNYLAMTPPGKFGSGCRFVWDGQDIYHHSLQDGTLLTLRFDVSSAAAGVYSIDFAYDPDDVVDNNLSPVNMATRSGSISIIQK